MGPAPGLDSENSPSLLLKLLFLIKPIVNDGSGDSEPFLSDAAIGLGCRGVSHDAARVPSTLFFALSVCLYSTADFLPEMQNRI